MELWLAEKYLEGRLPVPGPLLQVCLDSYVSVSNGLEARLPTNSPPANGNGSPSAIAAKSHELVRAQYDNPRRLFEHMLGPTMKYSMALWRDETATLEEAQEAMMADLCRKAGIRDGDAVLDVGCGFASFAAFVLRRFPRCTVTGLNLSRVQIEYIREKSATPGHPLATDRFRLIEGDFNTADLAGPYDRIVSIGFFEHVSDLGRALEKLAGALRPDGSCLLHYIVYFKPLRREIPRPAHDGFIGRYIFPGGRIWHEDELFDHQRHLRVVQTWFLSGNHYRRTLEHWHANFRRFAAGPAAETGLDPRTTRLWDLYLRACIAVFKAKGGRYYGNGQYLLRAA